MNIQTPVHCQNIFIPSNLSSIYFSQSRESTYVFECLRKIFDIVQEQNLSSHTYTFSFDRKEHFPWKKIIENQNILMSNVDHISDDIYFMSSCIEYEQTDENLNHIKNFKSWKSWCSFASKISFTTPDRVSEFENYKTCEQKRRNI